MQELGLLDQPRRNIGCPHSTRGRPGAQIAERMSLPVMIDEVDAGGRGGIDDNAVGVDVLVVPEAEQHVSMRVIADPADIAGPGALPRGRDQCVRRIAAEALQIQARIGPGLVELNHRLSQGHDIEPPVGAHPVSVRTSSLSSAATDYSLNSSNTLHASLGLPSTTANASPTLRKSMRCVMMRSGRTSPFATHSMTRGNIEELSREAASVSSFLVSSCCGMDDGWVEKP